jgi:hypothetical protein
LRRIWLSSRWPLEKGDHGAEKTRPPTTSAPGLLLPLGGTTVTVKEVSREAVEDLAGNTEKTWLWRYK